MKTIQMYQSDGTEQQKKTEQKTGKKNYRSETKVQTKRRMVFFLFRIEE